MAGPGEQASATLREEHQVILRVLEVLETLLERHRRGEPLEAEALGRCLEFFRLFADACHHAKEEDLLFPVLEDRGIPNEGGPIGVMLHEHRMARSLVARMSDELEALAAGGGGGGGDGGKGGGDDGAGRFEAVATDYLDLLRQHIAKEDQVLFPMGDGVMTAEDQQELAARFCEVGCRVFQGQRREELERLADELHARWGGGF